MNIKIRITEGHGCGGEGPEARMHRTTLAHLMADVKVLLRLIQDEDDLPEWLETKITKAGDYMSSAARYIAGGEARDMGQLEEADVDMDDEELAAQASAFAKADPNRMAVILSGEDLPTEEISEGLIYHLDNNILITENVYRHGSDSYFNLIKEVRILTQLGIYNATKQELDFLNENPDLGEWGIYEGEKVPLDFPLYENASQQLLDEKRKAKAKKDPPIGKPMKNTGGGKKYKVYVRNPKTGKIKKITYGDSKGGLKGNWNNPEARKSFAARHNCADKKDRTQAGYWACRAHKDFGTNVSGRFW